MLMACLTKHSTAQIKEASAIQPEQSSLELSAPNHDQSPMGAQVDCVRSTYIRSPSGEGWEFGSQVKMCTESIRSLDMLGQVMHLASKKNAELYCTDQRSSHS